MQTTVVCPNCRTENPAENLFCFSCGTQFGAQSSAAPQNPTGFAPPKPAWGPSAIQPPALQAQPSPGFYGTLRMDKLGARLDGWADLVEGGAEKIAEIQAAFQANVQKRQLPQVQVSPATLTPGGLAGKQRNYLLSQSYTGATMAIYFGPFGQDLYLAWELFVRPVIKWRNIAIMAGIAAFLALCPALISGDLIRSPFFVFITWILSAVGWFIPVAVGALIAGRILGGSFLAFFIEEIDLFAADDVTAMILAVHKSILAAVDSVGLDASLLREKERFTAGRRERLI